MASPAKTMIPAQSTLDYPSEAGASDTGTQKFGGSVEDKESEKAKRVSGFIFLCNQRTKLECYQYRVFGLPSSQKHVLEEIKSGLKLFLFDFELKLLYGVYEASSAGILNMEPAAFGGKFPAQVKFKIFKECLPIPESSLRYIINENYSGSKFKQELSEKQVTKLISSFRPLPAPVGNPGLPALANVPLPGAMPPSLLNNQLQLQRRLPLVDPYLAEGQYSHIRPSAEVRPVQFNYPDHGSHRRAAYVENAHPAFDNQSIPAANHYVAHPVQMQESSYSRYPTVQQRGLHDEFASYNQLPPQREALYHANMSSHNSYSAATDLYAQSYSQLPSQGRQYQDSIAAHSLNSAAPVQCTTSDYSQQVGTANFPAPHQDNATAFNSNLMAIAQYASSVLQRHEPVPFDQSSLQGALYATPESQVTYWPQYQNNAVPYNSNPVVVPAQSTSTWQPQASALNLPAVQSEASHQVAYNSYPVVAGANVTVGQPEVLPYASAPAPVPAYYPYPSN